MFERHKLVPFSLWKHKEKGGLYIVMGISLCSTNGPNEHKEECVVYYSIHYKALRHREINEFLDGRFVPYEESK